MTSTPLLTQILKLIILISTPPYLKWQLLASKPNFDKTLPSTRASTVPTCANYSGVGMGEESSDRGDFVFIYHSYKPLLVFWNFWGKTLIIFFYHQSIRCYPRHLGIPSESSKRLKMGFKNFKERESQILFNNFLVSFGNKFVFEEINNNCQNFCQVCKYDFLSRLTFFFSTLSKFSVSLW